MYLTKFEIMSETEGTVTIPLKRFQELEIKEQAFFKIKDGDKITVIEQYDYSYKIYSTDEAIRTLIKVYEERIERIDKEYQHEIESLNNKK